MFLWWPITIYADTSGMIIVPPSGKVFTGEAAVFSIFVFNPGEEPIECRLPDELICKITTGHQAVTVYATALVPTASAACEVKNGGFIKRAYEFTIPASVDGPVRFRIDGMDIADVMFAVAHSPVPEKKPEQRKDRKGKKPAQKSHPSMAALFSLYQPYAVNFSAYEPVYFLVGADPEDSKFQISFKYQFFNKDNPVTEELPWLKGLFFGYTQTSFWNLESDSAPFEDTIYGPELFFLSDNVRFRPKWMKGLFLQTGFQHESNGRGGVFSRSTNYFFAKPFAIFYDEKSQIGMQIAPKFWVFVNNDDDTNSDLEDYKGYFDLNVKIGKADSIVLGSNFRWAKEGGSIQFDLTYPLHHLFNNNFDLYLQVQYVDALAERFINYRERNQALRLGVAIVR